MSRISHPHFSDIHADEHDVESRLLKRSQILKAYGKETACNRHNSHNTVFYPADDFSHLEIIFILIRHRQFGHMPYLQS